jgi:glycosyltransferase involved in cell wall biosynthesis
MSATCTVTVVMAVRNGERYLARAVDSVLSQTMRDFELLVVDDGSTDRTGAVLAGFSDPRVSVIRNEVSEGAATARNLGLRRATGKYIAILDADDAAMPHRLETQVAFLEGRPHVGIVGSPAVIVDEEGVVRRIWRMPTGSLALRWTSLLKHPVIHTATTFRTNVLRDLDLTYDQAFAPAEDYDLCARVLAVTAGENLQQPGMFYRVHPRQLTAVQRELQLRAHDRIVRRTLDLVVPDFHADSNDITDLWRLFSGLTPTRDDRIRLGHLYLDLFAAFRAVNGDHPAIEKLARSVVNDVAFRCLLDMRGREWAGLAQRLIGLDALAPVRLPFDALRRTSWRGRWRWSPQVRHAAKRFTPPSAASPS